MIKSNFHTHSHYCDGKGTLRDYVERALALGFDRLGFSSHAPLPFPTNFALKQEDYKTYCAEVRQLQAEYAGRIELFLGLEIDYVRGLQEDFALIIEAGGLDYSIGCVHLVNTYEEPHNIWSIDGGNYEVYDEGLQRVFHGDIRRGVTAFFHQTNEMILRNHPTIVGHFNKIVMNNRNRYFLETEAWYRDLAYETVQVIADSGCLCEVNTRGIYKKRHDDFYPSRDLLRYMNEKNIPVIVGIDAHEPANLSNFEGAYDFLQSINYRNVVFGIR